MEEETILSDKSGPSPSHRSMLASLLSELFRDAETLLLQQLTLLRAETGEAVAQLVSGALISLLGIAVAFAGTLALIATVAIALAYIVPLWVASLLAGLAAGSTGVALFLRGRRLITEASLMPRQALRSWQQSEAWAREELT